MTWQQQPIQVDEDEAERLWRRLGPYDPRQVIIWQEMGPIGRLEGVSQAYSLILESVREYVRRRYPGLSPEAFNWHVAREIHGDNPLLEEFKEQACSQSPLTKAS